MSEIFTWKINKQHLYGSQFVTFRAFKFWKKNNFKQPLSKTGINYYIRSITIGGSF